MTTWITDQPQVVTQFLPDAVNWRQLSESDDVGDVIRLAEAYVPEQSAWVAQTKPFHDERVMIVVDVSAASQFDTAMELVGQHDALPDRLVCLAMTGSRFRGQRHRPWTALRGNLHLTAHFNLHVPAAVSQAGITMIPAIAAAESIGRISKSKVVPEIKWVNDIWVDDQKVSGVLSSTRVSGNYIDHVIFGIGINLEQAPVVAPTPFVPEAGCLVKICPAVSGKLSLLFHAVVEILDELVALLRQGQYQKLYERYRTHAGFIGQPVRIWSEDTEDWMSRPPLYCGTVVSMNADLSLNLDTCDQPIRTGRLAYERFCRQIGSVSGSNFPGMK